MANNRPCIFSCAIFDLFSDLGRPSLATLISPTASLGTPRFRFPSMASFEFDVDNVLSLMTAREKVAMLAGMKPFCREIHKTVKEVYSHEPTNRR
jgi:hypothetical protein